MRKLTYLKRFNENKGSNIKTVPTSERGINGSYCKDFKVKDLKEGDEIFQISFEGEEEELHGQYYTRTYHNWVKNINTFKSSDIKNVEKYIVIEIDLNNTKITLEKQ